MRITLMLPLILAAALCGAPPAFADKPAAAKPSMPAAAELTVDGVTYRQVRVLRATPRDATIKHSGGLTQVPIGKLPPEWRAALGYDAAAAAQYAGRVEQERQGRTQTPGAAASGMAAAGGGEAAMRTQNPPTAPASGAPHATSWKKVGNSEDTIDSLLKAIVEPPEPDPDGVDMRPAFAKLSLRAKSQGWRPSCSVFAVVSALEYSSAVLTQEPELLSEEYLIWATLEVTGRHAGKGDAFQDVEMNDGGTDDGGADDGGTDDGGVGDDSDLDKRAEKRKDAGFSVMEVVQALRTYGIAPFERMPGTYGMRMSKIPAPTPEVMQEARTRRKVTTFWVPKHDNAGKLGAIINLLNRDVPVVVGLRWPHARTLYNAPLLSEQKPVYQHAVTLVGYYFPEGASGIEQVRFIFKNSWGTRWGVNGYGYATYKYLNENLLDAAFLVVE